MDQANEISYSMTRARVGAGLTQAQLARRMCTTQSAIARMEAGRSLPTIATLEKLAEVTGHRLEVRLMPGESKSA
jgi:transcriptional regulator with XRE-family HTH domain